MLQKRFKRLRRIQDEESEEEEQKEADEERDAIANELFEGSGDVSVIKIYNAVILSNIICINFCASLIHINLITLWNVATIHRNVI